LGGVILGDSGNSTSVWYEENAWAQ